MRSSSAWSSSSPASTPSAAASAVAAAVSSAIVAAAKVLARAFAPPTGRIVLCGIVMRREVLRRGGVRIGLALVGSFRVRFVVRGRLGILVLLLSVIALGGVSLVLGARPFLHVMIFVSVRGLLQCLIAEPCGVRQRLTRKGFDRRTDSCRQRR